MKVLNFDIQRFVETVNGTAGHDKINVTASQQFINALGGNDTIYNQYYDNVTISGGDGADSIKSGNTNNSSYISNNVSISCGVGNDFVSLYGSNATVNSDDGDNYIYALRNNHLLNGGAGNDNFVGSGDNTTILGETGNDTVSLSGSYAYIDGGEGEDWLRTESGSNITITGGYGDDYLRTKNNTNGSMIGGSGADTLVAMGSPKNITIMGGWGNDSISLESGASALIYFTSSDNSDIVHGFDTNDTLQIAGSYSTNASDNNVIVTAGSGKVTLVNATSYSLNIQGTSSEKTVPTPTPTVPPNPGNGGNSSVNSQYIVYSGGNKTVSDYSESQQVNIATDFTGVDVDGDNFIVKSSSGALTIQNSRGKYVKYGDANSNLVAYSYMETSYRGSSSYSSVSNSYSSYNTIDARSKGAVYDVLIGGNNVDDSIVAGSGGSSLWGGNNGNDTLVGGSGYDEYIYKYGNGNDVIQGANSTDLVDLSSIKLSQITAAEVSTSGVTIRFTDGSSLKVEGNASGMSYKVAEGTYSCNQYNGQWTPR